MIQDCKVYDAQGNLKAVHSGQELSNRFWSGVLAEEDRPHSRIKRLRGAPKPVPSETQKMLHDVIRFLQETPLPKGRRGFTAGDIIKGLGLDGTDYNRSYQRLKTALRRAESKIVDGYRIRKTRQDCCQNRYEYFLQEAK